MKRAPWRAFRYWHEVVLGVILLALLGFARATEPAFVTAAAQMELSTHVWELALIAVPMTLVIISAGIDLSVGAMMGLSAVVLGVLYRAGLSPWAGAACALAVGVAAGLVNWAFVAGVKVHPLIVTLATLAAYRGIAEGISLGRPVSDFPADFALVGRGTLLGLPVPGLLFAVAAAAAAVILAKTPFGRSVYAIGHNETACRFSGIPVERIKLWLYGLSGALSGLAAVIFVARRNTAKADIGYGMELDVITAVVLGGTSIFGGRGRMLGTVLGVLLIHETREFVTWHWNRDELNYVVIGGLLILSVILNNMLAPKKE